MIDHITGVPKDSPAVDINDLSSCEKRTVRHPQSPYCGEYSWNTSYSVICVNIASTTRFNAFELFVSEGTGFPCSPAFKYSVSSGSFPKYAHPYAFAIPSGPSLFRTKTSVAKEHFNNSGHFVAIAAIMASVTSVPFSSTRRSFRRPPS